MPTMIMRVDLAGMLRNASDALRELPFGRGNALAFTLEETARHVEQVRAGEATLTEFCDLYRVPATINAELLAALDGPDPEMPEPIRPLGWLKSMIDECADMDVSGIEDPESWREMIAEVRALYENARAAIAKARELT